MKGFTRLPIGSHMLLFAKICRKNFPVKIVEENFTTDGNCCITKRNIYKTEEEIKLIENQITEITLKTL